MDQSGFDMYVFRDSRKLLPGASLVARLRSAMTAAAARRDEDSALGALIAAGELECALADAAEQDAQWKDAARRAAKITERIARSIVGREWLTAEEAARAGEGIGCEARLSFAVQEGFAYYALHPEKFIQLTKRDAMPAEAAVVGIRSIGAPLSAVVAAALGDASRRITVRPTGHPYDRKLESSDELRAFVAANAGHAFVIVDEGPGLSGSSFLAVAEALEKCGVEAAKITMAGSHEVDAEKLRAPRARERWRRFQSMMTAPEAVLPRGAETAIGGGWWRRIFLRDFQDQPACWPQLESAKYLSGDARMFYKFEGYGYFGERLGERARMLFKSGFGAPYLGNERGFGVYELLDGKPMHAMRLSASMIERLADYCAMRRREFAAVEDDEGSRLEEMVRCDWKVEFGGELKIELPVESRVIADARMLPHEWTETGEGTKKVDGCSHGDDHFFPGPCDIAWDVAGAIIEWQMSGEAQDQFVAHYERRSGDRIGARLGAYLLAYATFRMAWSKMASHASRGEFDETLLERDYRRYRSLCVAMHGAKGMKRIAVST